MKYPSTPTQKKSSPKKEEKPWPRHMVFAGYAAASIFIPYSIAWYLSMHKEAREVISNVIPGFEEALRSHFGVEEQISYQDAKNGARPNLKFIDEEEFSVRKQQKEVTRLVGEDVPIQIHVHKNGAFITDSTKLPGRTLAKAANLSESADSKIALDFDDLATNDTVASYDLMDSIHVESIEESSGNAVYSMWYYQPPNVAVEHQKLRNTSAQEIEMSRLEYTIESLEKELKDINSTRDLDDMRQELMKAKSELRSIRWKRRLGL
eukprot:CAMPEP_0194241614 /NCGR_PEP_ID=MMETSP0158-20130606/7426_1 /TAXON_ID=33649 /ORGANISM="Thalassionema nitzschioides, Strain L26-B" /LENGTH=263 /DNA_ID=CAMNT_0038976545 /DNA_START=133 /DNA_END=924 /DNA_ORIENTATION=-